MKGSVSRASLQWSHGLAAVETPPRSRAPSTPTTRFNGATALQPWKLAERRSPRSRWSRFNGATALQPWKRCCACSAWATVSCFNGATALQPWKLLALHHLDVVVLASMEPRPCSRGNAPTRPPARRTSPGFNGATALQPWKLKPHGEGEEAEQASMEPRPCSRGNHGVHPSVAEVMDASMEPRPCSRGNIKVAVASDTHFGSLQWSHGLAAVETAGCDLAGSKGWAMGPSVTPMW